MALKPRRARAQPALSRSRCGGCNVSETVQRAGSVYLSSPAAFVHGVEYPQHPGGALSRSILAVQARLLLPPNASDVRRLDDALGGAAQPRAGAMDTFTLLADALRRGPPLTLPTLSQLEAAERALPPPSRAGRTAQACVSGRTLRVNGGVTMICTCPVCPDLMESGHTLMAYTDTLQLSTHNT